ncbi:hypothetical protein, partial [Pseudomonas edaphica]|uniref:hypothetical protein n=1 Tax=Pseudomonas edaphica TaxID=2006980 RepID=UPI001F33C32F
IQLSNKLFGSATLFSSHGRQDLRISREVPIIQVITEQYEFAGGRRIFHIEDCAISKADLRRGLLGLGPGQNGGKQRISVYS